MPASDSTFKIIVENAYRDAEAQQDPGRNAKEGTNKHDDQKQKNDATGKPTSFMEKLNTNMGKYLKEQLDGTAQKNQQNAIKAGMGALGIQVSLGNLLKQSQVFTGIIGAIFSILGALFDIVLAPFVPLIAKFLEKTIPVLISFAEKVANFLSGELAMIEEMGLIPYIQQRMKDLWEWISNELPTILGNAWDLFTGYMNDNAPGWLETVTEAVSDALLWVAENIPEWLEKAWAWFDDNWPDILQGFLDFLSSAWDGIKVAMAVMIESIPDVLANLLDVLAKGYETLGPILSGALGWLVDAFITNIPKIIAGLLEGIAWIQENLIGSGMAGLVRFLAGTITNFYTGVINYIATYLEGISVPVPWGRGEWHPFSDIAPAYAKAAEMYYGDEGPFAKAIDGIAGAWESIMSYGAEGTRKSAGFMESEFMTGLFDQMGDDLGQSVEAGVMGLYGEAIPGLLRDAATGLRSEDAQAVFGNMASGVENFEFNIVVPGSKKHIGQVSVDRKNKKISEEYGSDTYLQSYGTQTINITPEGSSMDLWDLN